jgi:hypothetical protein
LIASTATLTAAAARVILVNSNNRSIATTDQLHQQQQRQRQELNWSVLAARYKSFDSREIDCSLRQQNNKIDRIFQQQQQ